MCDIYPHTRNTHTHTHTHTKCAHEMHTHTHTDLPLPLHRGESKTFQKGKVTGVSWKDNRVVNVLSTNTQPAATSSVLRRQKDGTRISVSCPESIMTYNQHMGGVDRGDQLPNKKQKVLQIRFYVFVRRGYY